MASTNLSPDDANDLRRKLETAFADFHGGCMGEAAKACRAILGQTPEQPDALHLMAMIAYRMNRLELALQLFDQTVRVAPNLAQAWSNRALVLRLFGRRDEALVSGQNAIAHDPKLASGWDITGQMLREKRRYEDAVHHHARAVALDPASAMFHNNYAVALVALHDYDAAWGAATKAAALAPEMAGAQMTLANILAATGHFEESLAHYRHAHSLDAKLADATASEGRVHFLFGEFAEGWRCMEQRAFDRERFASLPRWQGEKTGHLLLYAEQGIGDVIMFLRYLPLIAGRADSITLQAPAALKSLIAAHFPVLPLIAPDDPLPPADAFGLLMSVPYFLGTTLENVPAPIPYIEAREEWRAPWRARLEPAAKPRIGIVWAGNPKYANDHVRSLSPALIEPLMAKYGAHLVALQKDAAAPPKDKGLFDAAPWLDDFTSTAGLIAELDLVISVDTAVAHLAGAMGKPVWILIPYSPDWRWMLVREDSPWYPTARLFRQETPGDWPSALAALSAELGKFLAGDRTVLQPTPWRGKPARAPRKTYELPGN
ncbi:MAG TPA: tetratricopeptide repeat protein [Alphaproteobacteria bacterium]|nr:tetratricopeptide repeat protein [Alphaproteobacteria bacterium]